MQLVWRSNDCFFPETKFQILQNFFLFSVTDFSCKTMIHSAFYFVDSINYNQTQPNWIGSILLATKMVFFS